MIPSEIFIGAIRTKVTGAALREPSGGPKVEEIDEIVDRLLTEIDKKGQFEVDLDWEQVIIQFFNMELDGNPQRYPGILANRETFLKRYPDLVASTIHDVRECATCHRFSEEPKKFEAPRRLFQENRLMHEYRPDLKDLAKAAMAHGSKENFAALLEAVRDFRAFVNKHIEYEEEGGFMKPVLDARPNMAPIVDSMEREHQMAQEDLNRIVAILEDSRSSDEERIKAAEGVLKAIRDIRNHEYRENSLVLETFCTDMGTKD